MKLKNLLTLSIVLTIVSLVGCKSSENASGAVATARPTTVPTAIPQVTAVPTPLPTGDQTYTSEVGEFTITFPAADKLYENQRPSADGVLADVQDSIAIQDSSDNGYVLTLTYFPLPATASLGDFIDGHSDCADVASTVGSEVMLAGETARLYADTNCGLSGTTYLYTVQGSMGYRFIIETTANYAAVQSAVQPLLDSFHSSSVVPGLTQVYTIADADISLRIPAEWSAGEPTNTDYGQSILLASSAAGLSRNPPGMIAVAESGQTTAVQLANQLCGGQCQDITLQDVTLFNNIPAQFATLGAAGTPQLPWYFLSHNGKLVGLSVHDPSTQQPLAAIVQSLTFGQIVDAGNDGFDAVRAARFALANDLSVNPYQLVVVGVQGMTWPDGCLGVHRMGVLCTQVVSDGYVITFDLNGRYYQTNTNADGTSLVQVPGAVAFPGGSALTTQTGDTCTAVILHENVGVQAGPCDGSFTSYPFSSDTPQTIQNPHISANTYAPFHLDSPIGIINYNGNGSTIADPTIQRQIGELTRWIADAAVAGHNNPDNQLAISWQREGGIAGFCDRLSIYSYGQALGSNCQTDAALPVIPNWFGWFSQDHLGQLYDWQDQFASFDYTQTNAAGVADGMTMIVHFNGLGFTEASEADKQAIAAFASSLFAEANSPAPISCTLQAPTDVTVYQRPSLEAAIFGTLAAGETVQATMQTADGWLGFEPGVAQAANVGIFRLHWLAPDAAVPQMSGCDGLPMVAQVSPTACYFMAMTDTHVYAAPNDTSTVQATIPYEGYTAVTGQTSSGWYQLDLQDGSLAQSGTGWLNPIDANFNGPCDTLSTITP